MKHVYCIFNLLIGLLDGGWLQNNIVREAGDGSSTLFRKDHWIRGNTLSIRFHRLFELSEYKLASVADMFYFGWGFGEAWKWRRRLLPWEEELLRECVDLLSLIVL